MQASAVPYPVQRSLCHWLDVCLILLIGHIDEARVSIKHDDFLIRILRYQNAHTSARKSSREAGGVRNRVNSGSA